MKNRFYRVLRTRHIRWGLLALATLSMQGCGGCGCGGGNIPMDRVSPDWVATADPAAPPKPIPKRAAAAKAAPRAKLPETPKRPLDFAQWTLDDFLMSHEERDAAVPLAAAFLGKSAATNDESLWLLVQLLEHTPLITASRPATGNRDDDEPAAPAAQASGKVAQVILPILGASTRPQARAALMQVLRGTLRTDLPDPQAAELILKSLVHASLPNGQNDELLYQILASPEKWRAADDEQFTAEALQLACFKQVQATATPTLRARMAAHVIHPDAPPAHRERFGEWLAAPSAENLPAQIVLHNSDLLVGPVKARFREIFARQNSQALDQLLGTTTAPVSSFPSSATPAGTSGGLFVTSFKPTPAGGEKTPADPAAEMARQLWTPDFIDSISADLAQVRDLGSERELLLLACNLPFAQVRGNLHQLLVRNWELGVAPFEKSKLTFESIRDPGFLLLAKAMPREEARQGSRPAAAAPKPTPEQAAKQAWMAASEQFLRSLNARFYAASRMKSAGKPAVQPAASIIKEPERNPPVDSEPAAQGAGGLPLPLHKGAIVVGEYHLNWPADLQRRLPETTVSPLVLHYVRMEGEDRFAKISEWYKRQVKTSVTRNVARGQWFDGVQHDAAQRTMRSVDVLITRHTDQPWGANSPPESLTVEILWIEIGDPLATS